MMYLSFMNFIKKKSFTLRNIPILKSMFVLFHETVLSTYTFIVIPIKYRNSRAFVYDSAEKTCVKRNLIGYWTTKERI
jgi:hypothetical protein